MKGRSRRAPAKPKQGRESAHGEAQQLPDIRAFLAPARAPSGGGERQQGGAETTSSPSPSPWLRRPDRHAEEKPQKDEKRKKKKKSKSDGDEDDHAAVAAWTDLPAPVAAFQLPPFLFRASVAADAALPSSTSSAAAAAAAAGGDEPSEEVEDASLSSTWDGSPPVSPPSDRDAERQCGGLVVRLKSPSTSAPTTTAPSMHNQLHRSPPLHEAQASPQSLEDEGEEGGAAHDHVGLWRDKRGESDGRTGKAQAGGGGKGGSGVLEGEARHLRVLRQHVAHHSFFRQHDAAERAKNDLAQGQNRLFDLWDSLAPPTPAAISSPSLPPVPAGDAPSSTAATLPLAQREATVVTPAVTAPVAGRRKREQKDEDEGKGEKATLPPPPKEPPRAQVGSFSFAFTLPSSSSPAAAAPPARKRTKKPTTTTVTGPKGTAKRKRTRDTAKPAAD